MGNFYVLFIRCYSTQPGESMYSTNVESWEYCVSSQYIHIIQDMLRESLIGNFLFILQYSKAYLLGLIISSTRVAVM